MPSSVIAYMKYDSGRSLLRVGFVSGDVYEYSGVPQYIFDTMKKATSKGAYLNQYIKGNYPFKKIETPQH